MIIKAAASAGFPIPATAPLFAVRDYVKLLSPHDSLAIELFSRVLDTVTVLLQATKSRPKGSLLFCFFALRALSWIASDSAPRHLNVLCML